MEKEKCLVTEAMDKCQCEYCKLNRQLRDISLKMYLASETNKVFYESINKKRKVNLGWFSK